MTEGGHEEDNDPPYGMCGVPDFLAGRAKREGSQAGTTSARRQDGTGHSRGLLLVPQEDDAPKRELDT